MGNDFEWVRVERVFDAAIADVWHMWTDPDAFRQWYGPHGMTVPVAEMELRVGGSRKFCMQMGDGENARQMWFVGEFKEITPPTRLVYTESMADAAGNPLPPQGGMPATTDIIVELADENGRTRVKLTHVGVPAASPAGGGWEQALEKMATLLSAS